MLDNANAGRLVKVLSLSKRNSKQKSKINLQKISIDSSSIHNKKGVT